MSDPRELEALAGRVERLTGPDRIIGREVLLACGQGYVSPLYRWLDPTASLDAAMTLVPEGWQLRQMAFSGPCADDRKWHLNIYGGSVGRDILVGRGATPALALTAAALRARATAIGEKGR